MKKQINQYSVKLVLAVKGRFEAGLVRWGGKKCCGRWGNHVAGEVWDLTGRPGKGAAQEDDKGWEKFRLSHHPGPYPAEDR